MGTFTFKWSVAIPLGGGAMGSAWRNKLLGLSLAERRLGSYCGYVEGLLVLV
jgi:hypothetical protein